MAKGNKRNQFKIKETHIEDGVTLEEVRASMTDWFDEILTIAKKFELAELESCQNKDNSDIIKSNT